jgi:1-hydroxycarotenoid 3,4-desaturase
MAERQHVVVVGAGIGGLAAAARLARDGFAVTIVERAHAPGGKMRTVDVDGASIDAGPTVLTMRWVFDDLFGGEFDRHVTLRPAEILARHAWPDGSRLDLFTDRAASEGAIAAFAGRDEAEGYARFCTDAARTYATLERSFLTAPRPNPVSLTARIGSTRLKDIASIHPFTSYWRALSGYFRDPRLQQLFGRYATYVGSSPFRSPATLMLIAHVEQQGVWLVEGGMHALARAVEELAKAQGATLRYAAEVESIIVRNRRAMGVQLASGETIPADQIVFNGDPQAIATGRLGADASAAVPAYAANARSLSALCWQIRGEASGFPLLHHNVFFSGDYRAEFDALRSGALPADPTLYLCAQDRAGRDGDAPETDRMLVIANAPANGDRRPHTREEAERCTETMRETVARYGLMLDKTSIAMTSPADFEALFPATGGAIYGRASHGWMASFQRPGSATRIRNLWLAGGATHPGAGVPMAALSGRLAAEAVTAARASTRSFHPAAMPGGMSTRSAKTGATA